MKAEFPSNPVQVASSRIAICSWSVAAESPQALLRRIQQLRLSAVQVDLTKILDDQDLWADTIDYLRNGGVWVVSGHMTLSGSDEYRMNGVVRTGGILEDHTWFANRFHAEQVARVADRGSVPMVSTQIGPLPADFTSPEWAKLLDRLGALAEIFAHYGIMLAIETGQAPAESLDAALDQLNLANLGINFDPAGIILTGLGDPIESLRRLAARVKQAHIRNAVPAKTELRWGRETSIGRGQVDWDAFFEIALSIQPPIQFVIERDPKMANDDEIQASRDLIARYLSPRSRVTP